MEQTKISYTLAHHRDETIMVNVAMAGERWEVEFFEDGSVYHLKTGCQWDMQQAKLSPKFNCLQLS